jgi:hypothetical protein
MKHGFWADLFTTVCGCHWDLARIMSGLAFLGLNALAVFRASEGQIPTLLEWSTANVTLLTGCAIFISAKDTARAFATKGAG